ncbi:MAG: type I DNA topoisomerase [Clostridia bacterium]|nr:type I DNA topoisomerase [Clostridia bacterium]
MSKLVILESPSKAKTVQKYLGNDYRVMACKGHVRDLPKSTLGIDINKSFAPKYVNMADKKELISTLKKAAASSEQVYLATDPDREGEAISWHLATLLDLDIKDKNRVSFHEITKKGVIKGMENPTEINMDVVDAQQARRVLDRLVGYKLSPLLWKKVKKGLSAGRVQSVALRLIVDREKEIRAFVPEEFWSIDAKLQKDRKTFDAKLVATIDGKKYEIKNGEEAATVLSSIEGLPFVVTNVKKGVKTRQPAPPFNTSTLQQEASRKLNFTASRTMRVAQQLYEGIDVAGMGSTGLITYMRTDSLRISEDARAAANEFIKTTYGDKYLPEKPRYFKQKSSAQDAHEAVRPAIVTLTPDSIQSSLTAEQYKLYKLIWDRFMASLMSAATLDTVNVDIACGDYLFKSTGSTVKFDGFTRLYTEGKDEDEEQENILPALSVGDEPKLKSLDKNQHFTQPPMRYSEATLIKALEENGIGRPATYAPILTNIQNREYIEKEKKSLKPTPLGETVTELMLEHFKKIVDVKFTANMETNLDKIEAGEKNWVDTIDDFYKDFEVTLKSAEKSLDGKHVKVPDVETDVICELCGRKMVEKSGKFGKFLACPGYPECKNTKPIVKEMSGACPVCGGKMLQKKSKRGYTYYACENGPQCKFMSWEEPTSKTCPNCGKTLFKKKGLILCHNEGCGYQKETATRTKKAETK